VNTCMCLRSSGQNNFWPRCLACCSSHFRSSIVFRSFNIRSPAGSQSQDEKYPFSAIDAKLFWILVVCRVLCAKVVGVTASEGFLV